MGRKDGHIQLTYQQHIRHVAIQAFQVVQNERYSYSTMNLGFYCHSCNLLCQGQKCSHAPEGTVPTSKNGRSSLQLIEVHCRYSFYNDVVMPFHACAPRGSGNKLAQSRSQTVFFAAAGEKQSGHETRSSEGLAVSSFPSVQFQHNKKKNRSERLCGAISQHRRSRKQSGHETRVGLSSAAGRTRANRAAEESSGGAGEKIWRKSK